MLILYRKLISLNSFFSGKQAQKARLFNIARQQFIIQKLIRQKKRQAGKQTARQEKESREAQLAKYNRGVAKERLKRLKDFKFLLKGRPPFGIEPAVRNVSIKFTKLPLAI